jgi:hypothetical protein
VPAAAAGVAPDPQPEHGAYHVRPGQNIQRALDLAAANPECKIVKVHDGTYSPSARGQALIAFNYRHDGVQLIAEGAVTLSAANPQIADPKSGSYPAVVNHVVYFGDGVSRNTVLRGFRITGGNHFVTDHGSGRALEPRFEELRKTEGYYGHLFFYTDGAGIKIFGRSYPTLEGLEVCDNYASPCGGGVSIEHRGFTESSVLFRDCIFRGNRAMVTGSAVDLLPGSTAVLTNCLFVGNISNLSNEYTYVEGNIRWPNIPALVRSTAGYLPDHGSGALTVFPNSMAVVDRCTFTANYNGMDDRGSRTVIRDSIFWMNTARGGIRPGARYELDIVHAGLVSNCFIRGEISDLRGKIDPARNNLNPPDPEFDAEFRPRHELYKAVGYRPR